MSDPVKVFETQEVVMASGQKLSTTFTIPSWAFFCGILTPQITDGDITLQISTDGTNFFPVLDDNDGAAFIVAASGADPGWTDVSDRIRFVTPVMKLRLVSSVNAGEEETFTIQLTG